MKSVYFTVDIETIVSNISRSNDYYLSVYMSSVFMAKEFKKRGLKATFFVSMSTKNHRISKSEYLDFLAILISSLKNYDNIKIAPHIHAFDLSGDFDTSSDDFGSYTLEQQVSLLKDSKIFFENLGLEVDAFRPGGFRVNEFYYKALYLAGFKYSSTLLRDGKANIDLVNKVNEPSAPFATDFDIVEYPVTKVYLKSVKRKFETINLSPDFLTIESVAGCIDSHSYLNVNFHSFSIFQNRLLRENHKGQLFNNLKFVFLELPFRKILNFFDMDLYNNNTLVKAEFLSWLDYIENDPGLVTKFIGE